MSSRRLDFSSLENNPLLKGPTYDNRIRSGVPYREIPISEIDVDPDQPRRVFDTQALEELAASIREYGVISPILVRPIAGGLFRLVAGERRYRASKIAGLEMIPAVVDSSEDQQSILPKQLVENLQRQDLTPLERGSAFGQLRDKFNWSVREIARQLGVSKTAVQRGLDLLVIPEDLKNALINGASESKILLLSQVTDSNKRRLLLSKIDILSRAQLEREISGEDNLEDDELSHGGTGDRSGKSKKKKSKAVVNLPGDTRIVGDIQKSLGLKVKLERKKGNKEQGKLVLEFYSDEDLKEIYNKLV